MFRSMPTSSGVNSIPGMEENPVTLVDCINFPTTHHYEIIGNQQQPLFMFKTPLSAIARGRSRNQPLPIVWCPSAAVEPSENI